MANSPKTPSLLWNWDEFGSWLTNRAAATIRTTSAATANNAVRVAAILTMTLGFMAVLSRLKPDVLIDLSPNFPFNRSQPQSTGGQPVERKNPLLAVDHLKRPCPGRRLPIAEESCPERQSQSINGRPRPANAESHHRPAHKTCCAAPV